MARAAALLAAGHYADAAFSYRAVLSIDPSDHRAHLGLADCAVGRGQRDDAIDELVGAAQDFADRCAYEAAFALLGHALSLDPERLELHVDVAELEAASGQLEMAIGRLGNLARAYEQTGQYEDAVAIHEVLAVWTESPPTGPAVGAPEHVERGMTEPAIVVEVAPEPWPSPNALPVKPLLPGAPKPVTNVATESVLLRRAPPPPPPPRSTRSATVSGTPAAVRTDAAGNTVKVALPPAPTTPATDSAAASPPRRPAARGPARAAQARRWRPSTIQHLPEPPPLRKRAAIAAAKPAPTPPPAPTPAQKSRLSIAPAPSPSRGAVKLDRLPSLTGPCEVVSTRSIPSKISAKPSTRLLAGAPGSARPRKTAAAPTAKQAVLNAAKPVAKLALAKAPKRAEAPAPRPSNAAAVVRQPASRSTGSSLAERLRRASNSVETNPVPTAFDFDEDATRLWAPDGLLV